MYVNERPIECLQSRILWDFPYGCILGTESHGNNAKSKVLY